MYQICDCVCHVVTGSCLRLKKDINGKKKIWKKYICITKIEILDISHIKITFRDTLTFSISIRCTFRFVFKEIIGPKNGLYLFF